MMMPHEIVLAFLIGLSSSGHCLMMCGGIASSLASNTAHLKPFPRIARTLLFHIGRISCYAMLGFFIGDVLRVAITVSNDAIFYSRLVTGIMLIIIGCYAAGIANLVRVIEGKLSFIWRKLQPLVRQFIHAEQLSDAYALGFLWGFLPCGIIYSTLIWATSQVSATSTAVLMISFGLGTIPALFFSNVLIQKILSRSTKRLLGIALILFGLWTVVSVLMPHLHQHTDSESHPANHQHTH